MKNSTPFIYLFLSTSEPILNVVLHYDMVTCFLKTDLSSMHSMKNLADKKEYSLIKNNSGRGRRKKIARITYNKFSLPVLGWDGTGFFCASFAVFSQNFS